MRFSTIFFDLDDTLYASSSGLWNAIRDRMGKYMVDVLGLPAEKVPEMRRHYFTTYGTTLRGLQRHHQVNADEYLAYVHDLNLPDFIDPDPQIRTMIASLPQQKYIFTNADANHARRVLLRLELSDQFVSVIDVRTMAWACKPEPAAYQVALHIAGNPDPAACVMIDDSVTNLAPARQLGLTTVLIQPEIASHPAANLVLPDLLQLRQRLPDLWNGIDSG